MAQKLVRARRIPVWVIPLLYVLASALAGLTLPRIEHIYFPGEEHGLSVSTAQAFLSAASSGMMALTAIAFSIAFLVLQFTATAYSKRLILLSGQSSVLAHALGMCFATFVYALATLTWVDRFRNGEVPVFSTGLVGLLIVASLLLLALLVHTLAELRVTRVLRALGDKGRAVIAATHVRRSETRTISDSLHQHAANVQASSQIQTIRYSGPPLAIVQVDRNALLACARDARGVIALRCAVGDTLTENTPLALVFGAQSPLSRDALLSGVYLGRERMFDNDAKYPLRLLVDTAIMALSPAVNDPTTAVQALDEIEDLLQRLGCCELDTSYVVDESGELRVIVPSPSWDDYLSLALDEIRICGSEAPQVLRRLRSVLVALADSLEFEDRKAAVLRYLDHLDAGVDQSHLDQLDRATAHQADRQGLGLSRSPR